jgi:F420-dependent oxidoreductase-like protein
MKLGLIVPQGWTGEYAGWDSAPAWRRTVEVARLAERVGYESIWLFDHFHTEPDPTDELTFESFTSLTALATETSRVRLGHIVICAGFRQPSVVAKMIATMDVISGGRMELGIGAGWKEEEWLAYGFDFPSTAERLAGLGDALEVITRMLAPGRATYSGDYAQVAGAINQPKGVQRPRVPIMVGGNGPNRTWRLAARFADELNLDGMKPGELDEALPTIRARCEEIGRDPSSLKISVHAWWDDIVDSGQPRVDLLGHYRELGVSRVMALFRGSAGSDEPVIAFAADARAAGVVLEPLGP